MYTPTADDDATIASASAGMNTTVSNDATPGRRRNNIIIEGQNGGDNNIEGLLHGGNHLQDVNRNIRRQHARTALRLFRHAVAEGAAPQLPRVSLLEFLVNQGLKRPKPRSW